MKHSCSIYFSYNVTVSLSNLSYSTANDILAKKYSAQAESSKEEALIYILRPT